MKTKNYFLILLLAVFTVNVNAQEMTQNVATQSSSHNLSTPVYVPSIASRLADLPEFMDVTKEAQDKRSIGNTVIIGKDRQSQKPLRNLPL